MSTIKKIAGVAVLSLVLALTVTTVVGAQTTMFNTNLTVGSSGPDVVALQTLLVSKGYLTMPAGVSMGYFGALTKSAVAAWQAASGISPAAGYFGPLSRAAANSMGGSTSTVPGCAAGAMFSSTTGAPCTTGTSTVPGCAAGAMFSSTTGAPCTGSPVVGADGLDGSITTSYSPFAPSSQTIKKGETKDVIAVKLQATSGKVTLNRFDVSFSERPWLIFSQIQLKDSSGNVVATKALSSANDATEVQIGSNYLVRFDNVNTAVTPGTDTILVVSATVLAASDKITGQTVYVGIPTGSIRTINGKGYTDSQGITSGQGSGVTSTTGNAITLSSTGSTGAIYSRISPNTPVTRIITTSSSQTTPNVVLGVFSLKSQNQNSTINSLSFGINNSTSAATSTIFSNVRLIDGSTTYGAASLDAGSKTFTNLNIPLSVDVWKDLTLQADIASGINNVMASSSLYAQNPNGVTGGGIVGIDSNYNTVTVTTAATSTSNNTTFLTSGIAITGISTSAGTVTSNTSGIWQTASPSFTFTVQNSSNNDVFISKTTTLALATSTTGSSNAGAVNASTTLASPALTVSPSSNAADTSAAYNIPAGGSRTFTYVGSASNINGTSGGFRKFAITQINFGTGAADGTSSGQNAQFNVNFGLENLVVTVGS